MACSCTSDHTEHSADVRKSQENDKVFLVCVLGFALCVKDHMKMPRSKLGKEQEKIIKDNIEKAVSAVTVKCVYCCFCEIRIVQCNVQAVKLECRANITVNWNRCIMGRKWRRPDFSPAV
jgi:hypothetical protein